MRHQISGFAALLLAIVVTTCMISPSFADELEATAASEDSAEPKTKITDEITVYGEMTKRQLSIRFKKAQFDFVDLFNDLNNNPDFRVICEKKAATGTKFVDDFCEPAYVKEAAAQAFRDSATAMSVGRDDIRFAGPPPSSANIRAITRKKQIEAAQHMIRLMDANPSLRKKYDELVATKLAYDQSKESK